MTAPIALHLGACGESFKAGEGGSAGGGGSAAAGGAQPGGSGGSAGDGGSAGATGGGGQGGEPCEPGHTRDCYSGPSGTEGVGNCQAGTEQCNDAGTGYGDCEGEEIPQAEDCAAASADLDCNGYACLETIWAQDLACGADGDRASAVAIDSEGNIYVVGGYTGDGFEIGGMSVQEAAVEVDMFVAKLNPDGTAVWAKAFGGTGSDTATAVAVSAAGEVFVGGYTHAGVEFSAGPPVAVEHGLFVAKLDADGNPVLLHISHHPMVVNPIDPQHRNYTVVVKHAHCDRTILGLVPDATFASDYIGAGSRTGRDTFKLTTVGYRSDCSTSTPLFDEPNYIEVMSADYELVDDNLMVGTGTTSIYCRSKDTNSDGLITEEDGDGVLPEPDLCLTFGGEMPFPLPYATRITVRDARCEMSFPVMPIDCGE